mmetsp:Transcript_48611/g.143615  ORF Transcript_48611/g.143615 Transcript_48611/m.143615 type:complete len:106 (+) Transcript_48611:281-598(+)
MAWPCTRRSTSGNPWSPHSTRSHRRKEHAATVQASWLSTWARVTTWWGAHKTRPAASGTAASCRKVRQTVLCANAANVKVNDPYVIRYLNELEHLCLSEHDWTVV